MKRPPEDHLGSTGADVAEKDAKEQHENSLVNKVTAASTASFDPVAQPSAKKILALPASASKGT